jgi:iron complex outermembrane recepter protein
MQRFILWMIVSSMAFITPKLYSQNNCTNTLYGKVLDAHDGTPLSLATIQVLETGEKAISDSTGFFSFQNLCTGIFTFECNHEDCDAVTKKIKLSQQSTEVNFYPEHHEELLNEVVVESIKTHGSQQENNIHGNQLRDQQSKPLAEILKNISGVQSLKSGTGISKPVINGLYGSRIILVNQGVRQEDQQWGTEHSPMVDPFSAAEISVIKGPSAIRYGLEAIGGVIVIEPEPFLTEKEIKVYTNSSYQSNGNGGTISAKILGKTNYLKNIAYSIQGTRKYLGDLQSPDYNLSNTGVREWNGQIRFGWQKKGNSLTFFGRTFQTELGILRSAHIGNLTDLNESIQSGKPWFIADPTYTINAPRQKIKHHTFGTEIKYRPSLLSQYKLNYALQINQREEFDIRRGNRTNIPALDLNLITNSLDGEIKKIFKPNLISHFGFQSWIQTNTNSPTGILPLLPDYFSSLAEAYGLLKINSGQFENEIGIRGGIRNYNIFRANRSSVDSVEKRYLGYSASLGTTWNKFKNAPIKLNFNIGQRPPQIIELFSRGLHHSSATIEEGDQSLKPETFITGSVGSKYHHQNIWGIDGQIFFNRSNNFIYFLPDSVTRLTIRGAFPVYKYASTNVLMAGGDFSFWIKPFKQIEYKLQGSLIRSRNLITSDWLIFQAPDQIRQTISILSKASVKNSWRFYLQNIIVDRQYRAPANLDFAPPPAGYILWDIGGNYSFGSIKEDTHKWVVSFAVENIFNTRYRDYLNRFRYFSDEPGINFRLSLRTQF